MLKVNDLNPSPSQEKTSAPTIPRFAWVLLGLSLVYWVWLVLDLVKHPFDAGTRPELITPYLYRWLAGITGSATVILGLLFLRRVRTNLIVILMILYAIASTGWSMRTSEIFNWASIVNLTYFGLIGFPSISVLLWHFPDGRLYPVRAVGKFRVLVVYQSFAMLLLFLAVPNVLNAMQRIINPHFVLWFEKWGNIVGTFSLLVLPFSGVISLILRYRSGNSQVRSQIKWMVWLAGIGIFTFIPINSLLLSVIGYLYWFTFPFLAVIVAIQKNRLWDIDVLIRRTLVYGLLSATLAMIFIGSVILLEQVFRSITGQTSPVVIVISTLMIAALFTPLRSHIQTLIDRRFYRQKYNAEHLVHDFSAQLRAGMELEEITQLLVAVTNDALQPVRTSLWMRSKEKL